MAVTLGERAEMARAVAGSAARQNSAATRQLSIVVPVYNEGAGLNILHANLSAVGARLREAHQIVTDIVYVDDGSKDDSLAVAQALPATTADVQVVSLSRNFGKEAALLAGLDHAGQGAVLFIDGDGQHPPTMIETLVDHWINGGYDVVFTAKAHRSDESASKRFAVKMFYSKFRRTPATSACYRRARPRLYGNSPSATVSSRASQAGSVSGKSASTIVQHRAPMARRPGECVR